MAMTTCRECTEPVSDEAPACPSCGVRAPTPPQERSEWRRALIVVPAALAAAGLLVFAVDRWSSWQATKDVEQGRDQCREELIAQGHSPSDPAFDVAVAMCNLNR